MKGACHSLPKEPLCLVHLGRFGDIMIMLPAMRQTFLDTGVKPVMSVCSEFAGILDGVSYVEPWAQPGVHWVTGTRSVYDEALKHFADVRVPKWWDCQGMEPPPPPPGEDHVELSHLGRRIFVRPEEWDSYMYSQWKACGFTRRQMAEWPLVFDRRSPEREELLASYVVRPRPTILYNLSGMTSPVPQAAEVLKQLWPFRGRASIVDLSNIRAERIYDLLGLYDRASVLVTGDTATLHLAAAHKIPTIALINDGGAGSIVKCNSILTLRYSEILRRGHEIIPLLSKLL